MRHLVQLATERGGLPVDDVLALLLPLFRQVRAAHEEGRVAPLRGLAALAVLDHEVRFDPDLAAAPRLNPGAVRRVQAPVSGALDVSRGADRERTLPGAAEQGVPRGGATEPPAEVTRPRLVAGWQRWEHLVDHHDELTDIGSLGELLVALCCGIDLADPAGAERLAAATGNLFRLAPGLHPVVAGVAAAMVEPDRHRRAQDLGDLVVRLSTYRDQPEDFDLDRLLTARSRSEDRREAVLTHLRDRLFDLSRRNPLLHFRRTQRTLDLTEASVPLVLDVRSIRPAQLFTWGSPAARRLVAGRAVDVGSLVRWDDAPYAAAALDALISTARRDRAEYGQDQLRLVVAVLRWHNVKVDPDVAITSPLVLARAVLTKQRGVRDSYRLQLADHDAEVNPALRHQLHELYGFTLPASVDLRDDGVLESLRRQIEQQASASQPGVSVTMVDRPRIELIRSRAQTAMRAYRRRRPGGGATTFARRQYAYSYRQPGWAPLGIQIFRDRLVRSPLPLSVELGDRAVPRSAVAPVVETEVYTLDQEGRTNPYAWEVDLCAVTLANFNYRTLSLVRDYDALLERPEPNAAFDELFSTDPRDVAPTSRAVPLADRHLVVPADESQLGAIAQARSGDNFVIQGPPGTGKSQTITNLVADYVARGRRVLFVCQKRAALDVVHARLRSQGLDEICTLVHDSQQDKKAFVHGLRDTYESWLGSDSGLAEAEAERGRLVAELTEVHEEIAGYDAALVAPHPDGTLLGLLDRVVALREHRWGAELTSADLLVLPTPRDWQAARPQVDRLVRALVQQGGPTVLARSPVRLVDTEVLRSPRADARVAGSAAVAGQTLAAVLRALAAGPDPASATLPVAHEVAALHALLDPLARRDRLPAVEPRSTAATELHADSVAQQRARTRAATAEAAAAGWTSPVSPGEARRALEVARRQQDSVWRFLSGEWRRVNRLVQESYTGAGPGSVSEALALLVERDEAVAELVLVQQRAGDDWGHADLAALEAGLAAARRQQGLLAGWRDLLAGPDDTVRAALDDLAPLLQELDAAIDGVLVLGDEPLDRLAGDLAALGGPDGQALVRGTAPALLDVAAVSTAMLTALRRYDAVPDQVEYAVTASAVTGRRAGTPELDLVDGRRLQELLDRAVDAAPRLDRANAAVLTARLRERFVSSVELSQRSVSGMSDADRERKKTWAAGRRELEHEFGKVRAYKSIRQLASAEPGAVVAALRPVWLMSPASLSDTLPLAPDFDVVIFDEASQVPVEEAVPALYRAGQVVVVGDRMQLPPTQYFQAHAEPAEGADEDETGRVGVVLDADSFLAVSSVRLPSTMLLWHYRSRYEALIQFSNAAFYDDRLATIPDRRPALSGRDPLEVAGDPAAADLPGLAAAVLDRSISLLRVRDGVYASRTNAAEAGWIAHLVRELLAGESGLTIGVVAFSEAQQGEIERALEQLSGEDPDFATRYEAELNREEDGQGVGLFVKNLENVQGDERDIIVMSVCYAPGPDGRMRMNFGPINNAGGEKRLNVIFSRARQHMVLVSSIDATAVTNVYNDGANTLRTFLRYAAAVSTGDEAAAEGALAPFRTETRGRPAAQPQPAIVEQIAAGLTARGVQVALDVGRSGFRCDLALRRPGEPAFRTAVLVDHATRFGSGAAEERRLHHPVALASAGWRVEQVLTTEWWDRPEEVLTRLAGSLA